MFYEIDIRTPGRLLIISNRQIRTPFKIEIKKEQLSEIESLFKREGIENYTVRDIYNIENGGPKIIKKVMEKEKDPVKETNLIKNNKVIPKVEEPCIEQILNTDSTEIKIVDLKDKINEIVKRISKKD